MKKGSGLPLFLIILALAFILGVFGKDIFQLPLKSAGTLPDAKSFKALDQKKQFAVLDMIMDKSGPEEAWSFIKKTYATDSGLGGNAHDLAHYVGTVIFKNEGLDGFGICDPTFAFGCYHGFTEGMFSKSIDGIDELEKACGNVGTPNSGPWSSCIHGIGHGVATYFDSVELAEALSTCNRLTTGQTYCHDGVFMEFSISAPPSFYKNTDPLYPCSSLDKQYKGACGRNQPNIMRDRLKMTESEMIAACLNASDVDIRYHCIDSIGLDIGQKTGPDADKIMARCNELEEQLAISQCASAAAGELIFQNYPGWREAAPAICNSLSEPGKASCNHRIQSIITGYGR